MSYLGENDFKSAAADLRKATELNPRHTGAQLKLAELLANSSDKKSIGEAQKHAQAVLALMPDDPDALDVLAVADLRMGNPESAQSNLETALRAQVRYAAAVNAVPRLAAVGIPLRDADACRHRRSCPEGS